MKKIITLAIAALFVFSAFTVMIGTEADADDVPDTNWKDYEFTDADKAWYTNHVTGDFSIKTAAELAYLSVLVNGGNRFGSAKINFEPTDTIDLSAHQWTPIGYTEGTPFAGTFNGNNKTISGVIIAGGEDGTQHIGLFGILVECKIQNLKIMDSSIEGARMVGLVVGWNLGDVIECSVTDSTIKGGQMAGGIVGYNQGNIEYCYNTANVEGTNRMIGGITGQNEGMIVDCYNTGNISGSVNVGGIAGSNFVMEGSDALISRVYNTGTIERIADMANEMSIGGLVGKNDGTLSEGYNTGDVTDNGFIIGEGTPGDSCYWLSKTAGDGGLSRGDMTGLGVLIEPYGSLSDSGWALKANVGKLYYFLQLDSLANSKDPKVQADSLKSVTIDERTPIELTWSQVPYVFERGQMLSDIAADKYVTASQAGTIAWAEPDKVLTDAGDFTAAVEYTDDTGYYLPNEVEVSITVYVPTYTVTVTGGTASPVLGETGTVVTLTPGAAPEGQQFKSWNITEAGGGSISGNLFTIGTADATITAVWEDIPEPADRNNNSEETMMVIAGVIVAVLIAALCVVHFRKD